MANLTPETLRALGLTEEDLGSDVFTDTPQAAVAMGDARTFAVSALVLLQTLSSQLASDEARLLPASSEQAVAALKKCDEAASLDRFADEPRGVVVHAPRSKVRPTGDYQELSSGEYLLVSGAVLRLDGAGGSVVLAVDDRGEVSVRPLQDTALDKLGAWEPPGEPSFDVPSVPALTGQLTVEPWLGTATQERLDSPSLTDRVMGVGLLGRLWSPTKEQLPVARERALAGEGPGQSGRAWWLSLPPSSRDEIVRQALLRVDDLADGLEGLQAAVAEDPEQARPRLLAWLMDRDDLASLAFLERGTLLATALDRLDATAATYHSIWSLVQGFRDPRLGAVALRDFDAWWGRLAELS